MKKRFFAAMIFIFFLLPSFITVCHAEDRDFAEELYGSLPSLAQDAMPDGINAQSIEERSGISALLSMLVNAVSGQISERGGTLALMIAICVLGCTVTAMCDGLSCKRGADTCISLSMAGALCTVLLPSIKGVIAYLSDMSALMNALAPISAAILLSGASTSGAAASAAAMGGVAAITDKLCLDVLTPISLSLLGFSVCDCFGAKFRAGAISGYIKKAYITLIGFVCMIISFSMGMQSAIAAGTDSLSARSLKFVVGSSLPMVGSTVSASLSTLGASLSLIKNTVGVGAVIAVLAVALPALTHIFLIRFSLSLCAGVCSLSGVSECEKIFRSFYSLFDMLLAVISLTGVTGIIVISIFIKSAPAIGG